MTRTEHEAEAYKLGVAAAEAAASWAADGNSDLEHIRATLRMLEEGDPEAYDRLPARPDLSGEWADAPTPARLFEQVTGFDAHAESSWNYDAYQAVLEGICQAWEEGVADTFEDAVVSELSRWLPENVTSVWSSHGHRFISDGGDGTVSCLTCGASFDLIATPRETSDGRYVGHMGAEPTECSRDPQQVHGEDDAHALDCEDGCEHCQHECNCRLCCG